jgi:hypothetical protein
VGFNVDALNKIHAQSFKTTTWSFRVTLTKQIAQKNKDIFYTYGRG